MVIKFSNRKSDIGKSKAAVAAAFINKRISGCRVTPLYNRIEDFDGGFYRGESNVLFLCFYRDSSIVKALGLQL